MDGNEIRRRIEKNNAIIEATNPTIFVLNEKVKEALEDNERLRKMCHHEYDETGHCIYCDTEFV